MGTEAAMYVMGFFVIGFGIWSGFDSYRVSRLAQRTTILEKDNKWMEYDINRAKDQIKQLNDTLRSIQNKPTT